MTPAETELFHLAVLRVLDRNATRYGLGLPALCILTNEFGFTPTEHDMQQALDYLSDPANALVAEVAKGQFNPANRSWRITAKGTNELRQRGF